MSTSSLKRDRATWERLAAASRPEGRAIIAGRAVAAAFLVGRRVKQRIKQSPRLFRLALRARRFLAWPTLV